MNFSLPPPLPLPSLRAAKSEIVSKLFDEWKWSMQDGTNETVDTEEYFIDGQV